MRRFALSVIAVALLAPFASPAATAMGVFFPVPPAFGPLGVNEVDDALCEGQNQNPTNPLCEPFQWIDITVTSGPQPQFYYRPKPRNVTDSRDIPLGYISNPFYPIPTASAPRTYWVKSVTNLTDEPINVTRCQAQPWEGQPGNPACHVNENLWNYWEHVVPGNGTTMIFDDPASHKMKMFDRTQGSCSRGNYFMPLHPDYETGWFPWHWPSIWNQDIWITSPARPEMRGLIKHVYYDYAVAEPTNPCPPPGAE